MLFSKPVSVTLSIESMLFSVSVTLSHCSICFVFILLLLSIYRLKGNINMAYYLAHNNCERGGGCLIRNMNFLPFVSSLPVFCWGPHCSFLL